MYKNTLLAAKGGCICTPLTPPKSATGVDAATFCAFALMPWLQEAESACQVQYSGKVAAKKG